MRWLFAFAALATFAFAPLASAAAVSLGEVTLAPQFQTVLHQRLGEREGPFLQDVVADSVARALQRAGADVTQGAPVTVTVTLVDAEPNLPTEKQIADIPGLSNTLSVGIGGARLRGEIRSADGRVLAQIEHDRYSVSLADMSPPAGEWTDARIAIGQFADKIAAAYAANAR